MSAFTIRDAVWPQDEAAALSFIDGSQAYEHAFEPNRRLDGRVAAEFLPVLMKAMADHHGIARMAERDGRAIGWVVAWPEDDDLYVIAQERRIVYISELFVAEEARGQGVGRALIGHCEDWARAQGIGLMHIGVLPGNTRAVAIYRRAGYATYALRLRKYLR
jgi:ribosomal protein S18 acetylase RimI-like enzyme